MSTVHAADAFADVVGTRRGADRSGVVDAAASPVAFLGGAADGTPVRLSAVSEGTPSSISRSNIAAIKFLRSVVTHQDLRWVKDVHDRVKAGETVDVAVTPKLNIAEVLRLLRNAGWTVRECVPQGSVLRTVVIPAKHLSKLRAFLREHDGTLEDH